MSTPEIEDNLAVQSLTGYSETFLVYKKSLPLLNFSSHLSDAIIQPLPQILSQLYLYCMSRYSEFTSPTHTNDVKIVSLMLSFPVFLNACLIEPVLQCRD